MIKPLISLFERDLRKLSAEISQYEDAMPAGRQENLLWKVAPGINNSAGNLALHIVGNLNHFIGAILGNSDYQRDREAEFGDTNIPISKLNAEIESTISVVKKTLSSLDEKKLAENYPIEVFNSPMSTSYFLIHLYGHLNYHLGQVNYHRRLLT